MTEQDPAASSEDLYGRYHRWLTYRAYILLREYEIPPSVASKEDIVQTVFTKALACGNIRKPSAYLRTVLDNEISSIARHRARHDRVIVDRAAPDPLRLESTNSTDIAALVANRCAVERALAGLPTQQREVVWATKALGHTQSEVAELTGKRPGTVAVHASRAVVALRVSLTALAVAGLTVLFTVLTESGWLYVPPAGPAPSGGSNGLPPLFAPLPWIRYIGGTALFLLPLTLIAVLGLRWRRRRPPVSDGPLRGEEASAQPSASPAAPPLFPATPGSSAWYDAGRRASEEDSEWADLRELCSKEDTDWGTLGELRPYSKYWLEHLKARSSGSAFRPRNNAERARYEAAIALASSTSSDAPAVSWGQRRLHG